MIFKGEDKMKSFHYFLVGLAMTCFAGAISATSLPDEVIPPMQKVIAYVNAAHLQDQAY